MKTLALVAAALLASASAVPASAAAITYTFSGTFTGTLGGAPFATDAVFTGVGDTDTTDNGFGFPGILGVPLSSFSAVAGGTTYTITTPAFFYEYGPSYGLSSHTRLGFGFGSGGTNAVGLESPAFDGYDGLSSFATTAAPVYYPSAQFDTDHGAVTITGVTNATFGATAAVPEPASWAMMIGGVGLIGGALRRRQSVRTTVRFA